MTGAACLGAFSLLYRLKIGFSLCTIFGTKGESSEIIMLLPLFLWLSRVLMQDCKWHG